MKNVNIVKLEPSHQDEYSHSSFEESREEVKTILIDDTKLISSGIIKVENIKMNQKVMSKGKKEKLKEKQGFNTLRSNRSSHETCNIPLPLVLKSQKRSLSGDKSQN